MDVHIAHLLHRRDLVAFEQGFAFVEEGFHFGDGASEFVLVEAGNHVADVGQLGEVAEGGAAHVDDVEVDFVGCVGEGRAEDEGAEGGGFTGLGGAEDSDVAAGAGEVEHHGPLPLGEGFVFDAHGDVQVAFPVGAEPGVGMDVNVGEHAVEGEVFGQGWEPDLAGFFGGGGEPGYHEVEGGFVGFWCHSRHF